MIYFSWEKYFLKLVFDLFLNCNIKKYRILLIKFQEFQKAQGHYLIDES